MRAARSTSDSMVYVHSGAASSTGTCPVKIEPYNTEDEAEEKAVPVTEEEAVFSCVDEDQECFFPGNLLILINV